LTAEGKVFFSAEGAEWVRRVGGGDRKEEKRDKDKELRRKSRIRKG
jgi:hypothetical protein